VLCAVDRESHAADRMEDKIEIIRSIGFTHISRDVIVKVPDIATNATDLRVYNTSRKRERNTSRKLGLLPRLICTRSVDAMLV
jgi:hypothetical protein